MLKRVRVCCVHSGSLDDAWGVPALFSFNWGIGGAEEAALLHKNWYASEWQNWLWRGLTLLPKPNMRTNHKSQLVKFLETLEMTLEISTYAGCFGCLLVFLINVTNSYRIKVPF
jgi:hypothetical protein